MLQLEYLPQNKGQFVPKKKKHCPQKWETVEVDISEIL